MKIIYNEEDEENYTLFSINSIIGSSSSYKLLPLVRKAVMEIDEENEQFLNSLKKNNKEDI